MPDNSVGLLFAVVGSASILVVGSALSGAFLAWLILQRQHDHRRIDALERQMAELMRPRRFWYDEGRLDERTGLLAAAQLMKLSVQDGLDALRRLSPGLADEVVNDVMRRPSK